MDLRQSIGVAPYLFSFFRVYYCKVVENEIVATDPDETSLIYPQAMLFKVLQEGGRFHLQEPQKPLTRFGAGEAHAIALALEQNWALLINDRRPLHFAEALGIRCMSVADFCVILYAEGKITYAACQGFLKRLVPSTSSGLILRAEQVLAGIAKQRGEQA